MDFQSYITPGNITIAAGIAGGIVALALILLLILNRRAISTGINDVRQGVFSQGGLFYVGMGLFMIASIGTSFWNCAFGFFAPFTWFFQAIRAITSFSSPSPTSYFFA